MSHTVAVCLHWTHQEGGALMWPRILPHEYKCPVYTAVCGIWGEANICTVTPSGAMLEQGSSQYDHWMHSGSSPGVVGREWEEPPWKAKSWSCPYIPLQNHLGVIIQLLVSKGNQIPSRIYQPPIHLPIGDFHQGHGLLSPAEEEVPSAGWIPSWILTTQLHPHLLNFGELSGIAQTGSRSSVNPVPDPRSSPLRFFSDQRPTPHKGRI